MIDQDHYVLPKFYCTEIDQDFVLWFENSNKYVLVKLPIWDVVQCLNQSTSKSKAIKDFAKLYEITEEEAGPFINSAIANFRMLDEEIISDHPIVVQTLEQNIHEQEEVINYKLGSKTFSVAYNNAYLKTIVHSLFQHLVSDQKALLKMKCIAVKNDLYFQSANHKIWKWPHSESHFMRGRVFMEILRLAYEKSDSDWMSIMHAACITNGESAILVTADSGGGKSTFSALCRYHGLKVLSDDFTPIDLDSQHVYAFPAATSIKEGAYPFLKTYFPELERLPLVHFNSKRNLRFLPPQDFNQLKEIQVPVKAIVFINYTKDFEFDLQPKTKVKTLQSIFDQAWLSPNQKNAETFLNWIKGIDSFDLKYSASDQAIDWLKNYLKS